MTEVAEALRTTRKAVYALIQRGHLPGVVRLQRRIRHEAIQKLKHLAKVLEGVRHRRPRPTAGIH